MNITVLLSTLFSVFAMAGCNNSMSNQALGKALFKEAKEADKATQ